MQIFNQSNQFTQAARPMARMNSHRRPSPHNQTPRQRHFTLVELLVVIGIITVLAALLLPALKAAMTQAYIVKCVSQQQQLTMAIMTYTGDNRGGLPPYAKIVDGYANFVWYKSNTVPFTLGWGGTLLRDGYIGDANLLLCPDRRDTGQSAMESGSNKLLKMGVESWNSSSDSAGWGHYVLGKQGKIHKPAKDFNKYGVLIAEAFNKFGRPRAYDTIDRTIRLHGDLPEEDWRLFPGIGGLGTMNMAGLKGNVKSFPDWSSDVVYPGWKKDKKNRDKYYWPYNCRPASWSFFDVFDEVMK